MGIKLNCIAPLLAAGAAAVAIAAAPVAAAAPSPSPAAAPHGACDNGVSGSICDTPGDVGITAGAPPVNYDPYGDEGFLLGYGGGFGGFGGFHGGGFGLGGGGFHGGGGGHGR
jgi:hypothetical protein